MDWELIFWVVSPFVVVGSVFIFGYLQEEKHLNKKRKQREQMDDFNKDFWDENW